MVVAPRRSYLLQLPTGASLRLGDRTLIMGILNITPDSFAERAPRVDASAAVDLALEMEAQGADLIDIGGESTRPGAAPVTADEELARVMPVIERLAGRLAIPLSIDTTKAAVARAALAAGALMVNDISGLQYDPALGAAAAEAGAPLVLMHMRGRPDTMAARAVYDNPIAEVTAELRAALARAASAGMPVSQTVVDPGIGFAKRPEHSYGVLARLPELAAALDRPLLVGASRKSFMREALGEVPPPARDWGTAAAVSAAVFAGAHIVRVHAVAAMRDVVRVADALRRYA